MGAEEEGLNHSRRIQTERIGLRGSRDEEEGSKIQALNV